LLANSARGSRQRRLRKIDLRLNRAEPDTVAAIEELAKRNDLAHLRALRR